MFSFLICFDNCFFRLPEAVAQLLSDKLKEVANHTRQFTKKKRLQSNNVSENSYSSLSQETLELSKDTYTEENLLLQNQLTNDAAVIDETRSKSDTRLMQFNQDKDLSTMSEILLEFSQVVPCQSTSETKEESSAILSKHHNEEQITFLNQDSALSSEPKLYQSNHTEQNNEHTGRNRPDKSDPAASSELKSSTTDSLNQECNEQNNIQKRTLPQSPSPSSLPTPTTTITITTETTTTNTTTVTTTKTITPYVSILMHLKKPR